MNLNVEHVNVKIFAREPATAIHWPDLIPVFHRWIQQQAFPDEMLIDVADYAHVPAGPGIMLIGHHANISLDNRANRLGMLYSRKTTRDGPFSAKLRQSYEGALRAARRLEQEPEFHGKISFPDTGCEIFINDRLSAPNTEQTWAALKPELESFFANGSTLHWCDSPRELFRVRSELRLDRGV